LFVTLQDGSAFGNILAQAFKGYNGCTWCMDKNGGIWLKHCKKVVYMGIVDFCEQIMCTEKNKKTFDGTIEKRHAPKIHSGEHMFRMAKDLKVVLGKEKGGGSKKTKKV
jgi:hypothetical protein